MKEKVHAYIKKHQMIKAGDSVLVGVSGGADSLALLHFLSQSREDLGIRLGVAHLHHGMRGRVADGDAAFVEAICHSLDVPFCGGFVDVPALAGEDKVGVEVAGRQARYAFFREIMDKKGFTRLATAHHLDDHAETVLMRLIRGTGMVGAAGIPAVDGQKIRPFLCVTREEIEAYCKVYRLDYRHDCTNDDYSMTRNRLRHDIIPQLKAINPQVAKHLAVFAEEALDYEAVVEDQVALWGSQHFVIGTDGWLYYDLECFLREPPF
ncbi:tRNA lysidine(34) synthetase TilS, partial [Eubacterium aggregans]|uniref:tRNA lysidine(34) synthetase TilS n=1 Tax=Eubacterium aggregans TaxID=81409 RepID=UPI003F3E7F0D